MLHADLREIDLEPHHPQVLSSSDEGRAIAIALPGGEEMQDHEVHERSFMTVVDGEIEVLNDGSTAKGTAGSLFVFEPKERRTVRAVSDARLLLVLAPWPGAGHPSRT
jgi:quercetin dioxygenase-like cupin family protein